MDHHDDPDTTAPGTARRLTLVTSLGSRALEEGLDLDALLGEAAAHAAEGLGIEFAQVLQYRPEADDLLVRAGVGWRLGVVGHTTLSADLASPSGRSLRTGESIALEDLRGASGFECSGLLLEHGVVSLLNVPVRVGAVVWGVLEVNATTVRRFGPEHEHFLWSLASLLGAAIRRLEAEAQRRMAEEGQRRQIELLAAITDNAAEALFLMDPEGRVTFINPAAERMLGWPRDELLGRVLHETVHHHHPDGSPFSTVECPLIRVLASGRTLETHEDVFFRRDGTPVPVSCSSAPIASREQVAGAVLVVRDITRRRRAEEALRVASARAETLAAQQTAVLGQLAEGVIVSDPTGRITFVNEAAARIHGVARLDVLPEAYSDAYHLLTEDNRPYPSMELPLARAALHGETVTNERWRIRRPDGTEVLAVGSARPVLSSNGMRISAVLTLRDETGRDAAEQALRESEARLRALADNIPGGMAYQLTMQRDGSGRRFVYVSRACEHLTGVPAEAALADPEVLYATIAPEYRSTLAAAEQAAIQDRAAFDHEVPLVRADGRVRWGRIVSAPREMPDGSLVWDGLLIDVTDRRQAVEALREEAHCLEVLNRTGALLAAELDLERIVQAVTDAATELSGAAFGAFFYNTINERNETLSLYTVSGVPRAAFARFPMPRNTAIFAPTLGGEGIIRSDDILADPRYGRNAPYHGMPEGHLPVRSYLGVPVASRCGEVLGGLFLGHPKPGVFTERAEQLVTGIAAQAAVAIDNARLYQAAQREIAARAAAEMNLQRLNETLEQRIASEVAERAKTEEALRQAQKMEAIGQLTGGIAHDFNNLLQGVVGSLHMLRSRAAAGRTADLARYVDAALASADRAAALTHRLLAFARRQPLDPKAVDVNRLVASLQDLVRRTVGPAVQVEVVLAGGLWPTLCDPHQLENALLNLCINARDAMPDGGRLTIETANAYLDDAYIAAQRDVTPGQYVALCVTDTGTGMTPEVIARAFDPFFTTKPLGQGTGLGLSMIYGFTRQSNGHVRIYSEEGRGTTVKLYLPRHREEAEAESAPECQEAAQPRAEAGEAVLVVEDEAVVRLLIVEVLEDLGYLPLEAEDAAAGLRMLRTGARIDLLVTDVGLPGGMNGRQLADVARQLRPDLKVLFITGYAQNAAIGNGILEPGMQMLTKPFALDALVAKISTMLGEGAPRGA
jgi:PAS domain S-box-containing protein